MSSMTAGKNLVMAAVLGVATVLVFVTDLVTMAGFAHGMLYIVVVLIAVLTARPVLIIGFSIVACALILTGYFLSPSAPTGFPIEYVLANRLVSIMVIVTACVLAVTRIGSQTRHQKAESQLDETRRQMRLANEVAGIGTWSLSADPSRLFWSEEVHRLHGTRPGDEPDMDRAIEFYIPEHRDRIRSLVTHCLELGEPFDEELQIIDTQGQRIWVRAVGLPTFDDDGQIVGAHGTFMNIEDTKRIARRLTTTLESITDAFFLLDREWRFTFLNARAEQLLERRREDLLNQIVWDEFPEARDTAFERHYRNAVRSGESTSFESLYPPLDRWFSVHAYPSEEGLAVYFRDVTEHKNMEEQLRNAQRLEVVGQLTGGIAHDFNNLLTVILGNAELVREELPDGHPLGNMADIMVQAAQRGSTLTQQLLAFARRQALESKPVDINRLLANMDGLLRRALGDHIEIELSRGGGLWLAMVDESQLESAVLNLCLNARDAMSRGGRLTIETANVRLDVDYAEQHSEVKPGQYVMVAVSDTGKGIESEHLDKVFEPFFTTKAKGKGTGLGLSMIYGFVKQSSGHVKVYSEPGEGTTVRLYLPRAYEAAEKSVAVSPPENSEGGRETILLVEDDDLVRQFAEEQLRQLGYRTLVAENGPQAIELVREHADIDLLFTDVVMPGGMSGRDLADQALTLRPDLKVLYTSGYTENAIVHHGRLDPDVQLLQKPYRRSDLARRLRGILDGKAQTTNNHNKHGTDKP